MKPIGIDADDKIVGDWVGMDPRTIEALEARLMKSAAALIELREWIETDESLSYDFPEDYERLLNLIDEALAP